MASLWLMGVNIQDMGDGEGQVCFYFALFIWKVTEMPVTVMYDSCGMCANATVLFSSGT